MEIHKKSLLFIALCPESYHIDLLKKIMLNFSDQLSISFEGNLTKQSLQSFIDGNMDRLTKARTEIVIIQPSSEMKLGEYNYAGYLAVPVHYDNANPGTICDTGDCWKLSVRIIKDQLELVPHPVAKTEPVYRQPGSTPRSTVGVGERSSGNEGRMSAMSTDESGCA